MNVIDLLPDHPPTPQRQGFETLLPDLVPFLRLMKNKAAIRLKNCLCGSGFQVAGIFFDATILGIGDQMKVIGIST